MSEKRISKSEPQVQESKSPASDDARKNSKAEQIRLRRLARSNGNTEPADWGGVDGKMLARAIASVTNAGFGITLSLTKDGGAYAIRCLGNDSFESEYVRPTEDINLYLENLAFDFEAD